MKVIEQFRAGAWPSCDEWQNSLVRVFPLLAQLKDTPQDSEWHGEGDVFTHCGMVLEEVYRIIRCGDWDLPESERLCLVLGALLHDIGKALTTREEMIDGKPRIISPHHPDRGRSYVAPRIGLLGLSAGETKQILGLIRHHHDPKKLVNRSAGLNLYRRLSRCVDLRLVYLLEMCDLRGRICSDLNEQLEIIELFRIEAEALGCWERDDPYSDWKTVVEEQVKGDRERDYTLLAGIRDFEQGLIQSPEEAIARGWNNRDRFPELTILTAPSGSGKSTWIDNHCRDDTVILSLDEMREEVTGKAGDQSKNGQVMQLAKERLKAALRERRSIVWDSTSLRRDGRRSLIELAIDYHALTRIVSLGVPPEKARRQNAERQDSVPGKVLETQYRQWQWPERFEAHRLVEEFFG